MSGAHTPGPWETSPDAVPDGHIQITVYAKGGSRVATVFQNEANARLMAAAPEMLEALNLAQATIERLNRHGSANGTLDVLRNAIAKAVQS